MNINKDKVNSLLTQIEQADVIVCDDSPYLHSVNVLGLVEGGPDNEILQINWHDDEGLEYLVMFTEENLDNANFVDNVIKLNDLEGNSCQIKLYSLEQNPVIKNW
jgi:hypothetical protein